MLDQYNQQKEQAALFQYKKGAIEDEYEVGKELGRFLGIEVYLIGLLCQDLIGEFQDLVSSLLSSD